MRNINRLAAYSSAIVLGACTAVLDTDKLRQSQDGGGDLIAGDSAADGAGDAASDMTTLPAGITVQPTDGHQTTEVGGTASFTIVLTSAPTANVAIGLSSSDESEGIVSPTTITFNGGPAGNWNVAQRVTITGVDDDVADENQVYMIVTAPASSSDANYNGLNADDVTVTNIDDETPGITVTAAGDLRTSEGGTTADFTISINTEPTADVTVPLSSSNVQEGTVPDSVTFTPGPSGNWATPQTVTITGVDDPTPVADGPIGYMINIGDATSADATYNGRSPSQTTVSVTNDDNDTPGFTVTAANPRQTTEAAGPGNVYTFTIAINTEPTADVTVGFVSTDATEATVSPANVTFMPGAGWDDPIEVTVTGVDDDVDDDDRTYTIITSDAVSTDDVYGAGGSAALNPDDVSDLMNIDDDEAGVTVTAAPNLSVADNGENVTFDVVLDSEPIAEVTIDLVNPDATQLSLDAASLTFTAGATSNWDTPQTVTVTGVANRVDEALDTRGPFTIALEPATSTDSKYGAPASIDPDDVSVTVTDDDVAGITVQATPGLWTNEATTTATFTVVLDSEPLANVDVPITSPTTTEVTVGGTASFTPGNWNVPRTITLTGVADSAADGDVGVTIALAASTSTDGNYAGIDLDDIAVTNYDIDTAAPGFIFGEGPPLESVPLFTNEGDEPGAVSFSVRLRSPPAATETVTFTSTSSDPNEVIVTSAPLTFDTVNWMNPQTVTIQGVDDTAVDGDKFVTIQNSVSSLLGGGGAGPYDALDPVDVPVVSVDRGVP